MKFLIYQITNNLNGMVYVGLSGVSAGRRWIQHKSAARKGESTRLYNAIRTHGEENFTIEEICRCPTREAAAYVEQLIIKDRACRSPGGYNLTAGGDAGSSHSDETKSKISALHAGWVPTAVTRARMSASARGRRHTPESREKCRQASLKYWNSRVAA